MFQNKPYTTDIETGTSKKKKKKFWLEKKKKKKFWLEKKKIWLENKINTCLTSPK